jgi:hypothetical protein
LLRWVRRGIGGRHDSARKTHAEEEAGLLRHRRRPPIAQRFVARLAASLVDVYDAGFRDPNAPVTTCITPRRG